MSNHESQIDRARKQESERWYQRYNFILLSLQEAYVPLIVRRINDPELNAEYERIYGEAALEQLDINYLGPSIPVSIDEQKITELERASEAFIAKVHTKYPPKGILELN